MSDWVKVYSFMVYDIRNDTSFVSPTKREPEQIALMGYVPMLETEQVVDRSQLDDQGRYTPHKK